MAAYSGFREDDYDEVFIILDKMDKIGAEGVAKELEEMGYLKENVETYLQLFKDVAPDVTGIRFLKEKLGDCLSEETADSMEMIISSVETAKECEFNIKFDPTLVRASSEQGFICVIHRKGKRDRAEYFMYEISSGAG